MEQIKKPIPVWQFLIVLFIPVLYIFNSISPWSTELWEKGTREYYYIFWGSVMVLHWFSVGLVFYFLKINNWKFEDIGYNLKSRGTLLLIGSYLLIALGALYIAEFDLKQNPTIRLNDLGYGNPSTMNERLFWIFLCFSFGFCEEIVWRGFGINALESRGVNKWLALLITTLSFTCMHGLGAITSLSSFLVHFILGGMLFGILYFWKRLLWIPMIIHMFLDVKGMI